MISDTERDVIIRCARKFGASRAVLFGSCIHQERGYRDIDIAVEGIPPHRFFKFYAEIMRQLNVPVDVIDLSLFDQHWIKPRRLPITMGRFYRQLFEPRHQGDYANMVPLDEVNVSDLIDEARRFMEQIEQIIRHDFPDTSQEASQ